MLARPVSAISYALTVTATLIAVMALFALDHRWISERFGIPLAIIFMILAAVTWYVHGKMFGRWLGTLTAAFLFVLALVVLMVTFAPWAMTIDLTVK